MESETETPSAISLRIVNERRASELSALEARTAAAVAGLRELEAARRVQRAVVDAEIGTASRSRAAARRAHAAKRASSSTVEQVAATFKTDERALVESIELKEAVDAAEARARASVAKLRDLQAQRARHVR